MKISFIVLTYNRSDALLAVLRGLAPQCNEQHEVLVADDGSRIEHQQALREGLPRFDCRVRHVWHPDTGFTIARARNLCAARASGDYLVFLDGDCIPNPQMIAQHVRLARQGYFVIGGRVLLGEALTRRILDGQVDLGTLGPAGWLALRMRGDVNKLTHLLAPAGAWARNLDTFRWKGIRGCNMAFWREDYEAVNGFDEAFSGWGHEDADLVLRLHRYGIRRRNSLVGTEVYHLWHRQNSRDNEDANRQRVLDRLEGGMIRASKGVSEAVVAPEAIVTELN